MLLQTPAPGGEIAEVQLLQVYLDVNGDIDTQFQVWLSITFAVLVASFVAGLRLSRGARIGMAILYACAAVILYLRYTRAVSYIGYVYQVYRMYHVVAPEPASTIAYELRRGIFIFGSAITALGVLFPRLGHREVATED